MIRAIIFDCFGVLTTESWLAFKRQYFGHDEARNRQATELLHQADCGLLGHEEFTNRIAEMAGISPQAVNEYLDKHVANEELFAYIKSELKPKYKIGLLSNAAANWLNELFTKEQLSLLDVTALSFESGVAKPDKQAYLDIAERFRLEPEQCVLVDDQERHYRGALEAGMQGIYYHDFAQFKADLEKLLAKNR